MSDEPNTALQRRVHAPSLDALQQAIEYVKGDPENFAAHLALADGLQAKVHEHDDLIAHAWEDMAEDRRQMARNEEDLAEIKQRLEEVERATAAIPGRRCPVCNGPLASDRAVTCSNRCRQKLYRQHHAHPRPQRTELERLRARERRNAARAIDRVVQRYTTVEARALLDMVVASVTRRVRASRRL